MLFPTELEETLCNISDEIPVCVISTIWLC
jgi:hypothetical protein